MADKSAYMGAGGYSGGATSGGGNYTREEYAFGGPSANAGSNNAGGGNRTPGVTKPRTDVSCYLGP